MMWSRLTWGAALAATLLAGCGETSFVQKNSPADAYKDYRADNLKRAAVLGMGEPISKRQMASNATFSLKGELNAEEVMGRLAGTYNVAIRWGNGVRKAKRHNVVMNNLSFEEARSYIEDVFKVQVIREGDRRLLVLPSAAEPRLKEFTPGENVSLAQAVRGLAEQCNYNIVVRENKEALANTQITTTLRDVTCYDAFEALLAPSGLSLVDHGDFYSIGGLPQRQWTVNLDEPERDEEVTVNYSSDIASSGEGGGSSSTAGGTSSVSVRSTRNLWEELQEDLQNLLENNCQSGGGLASATINQSVGTPATLLPPPTAAGGTGDLALMNPPAVQPETSAAAPTRSAPAAPCGYVRINRTVGLVQMQARQNILDEADEIIRRVSDIAGRRLLLESRVLAVSRTRGFDQRGIVRGGIGDRRNSGAGSLTSGGSITSLLTREIATLSAANIGGSNFNPAGFSFTNNNLEMVVGLIEQYGTTYELMHPMMELMDRQRSTMIDGRNERYFVIESESTTGTTTTTNNSLEERSQFLGLQFSASAQIADAGEPHTVSVQIPITSLVRNVNIPDPNDPTRNSGQAPIASTRLIDQKVRLHDGEIKVIGGLTKTIAVDRESGVPVAREVPGFGKLANEENLTYENVEFVVLLQVRRLK